MIDPENLDPLAKEAFKLLAQSEVFRKQQQSEFQRLMSGDSAEEPEQLAERIKEYRRRASIFEGLHLLGEEFKSKEREQ